VSELDALENSLAELEQELFRLRPAVVYYCSQKLFTQIPEVVSRFNRCLSDLRLERIQRARFAAKEGEILALLREVREKYPQLNRGYRLELEWLEEELGDLRQAFESQNLSQVLRGSGLQDLNGLRTKVDEFCSKLAMAHRPPSTKNVPQRGRPRVHKKSRGTGRHSRR